MFFYRNVLIIIFIMLTLYSKAYSDGFDSRFTDKDRESMKQIETCATPLESELVGFHWGNPISFFSKKNYNDPEVYKQYALGKGTRKMAMAGEGYYFSKSPSDSTDFGDKLSLVRIKKGSKYLDINNLDAVSCLAKFGLTYKDAFKLAPNVVIGWFKPTVSGRNTTKKWFVLKLQDNNVYYIDDNYKSKGISPAIIKHYPNIFHSDKFGGYYLGRRWPEDVKVKDISLSLGPISYEEKKTLPKKLETFQRCSVLIKDLDFSKLTKNYSPIVFKMSKECDYKEVTFYCSNVGYCKNDDYKVVLEFKDSGVSAFYDRDLSQLQPGKVSFIMNKYPLRSKPFCEEDEVECKMIKSEDDILPSKSLFQKIKDFIGTSD